MERDPGQEKSAWPSDPTREEPGQQAPTRGPGGQESRREIRRPWTEYLSANGEGLWAVTRYILPQRTVTVPTIAHQGVMADRHEDKVRMLMDSSFLEPAPYDGDEGTPGPPGETYIKVTVDWT